MPTAWSLLALDQSSRQFRGNSGYEDVLDSYYTWDQTVPNYAHVKEGDLAVLRDAKYVLGIGWIDQVSDWRSDKERFRCTHCGSTGFKHRKTKKLQYKCSACGHEFHRPAAELLEKINYYRADYARTWQPLDVVMPIQHVESAYVGAAKQHSIREMKLAELKIIIEDAQHLGSPWWLSFEPPGTEIPGGHSLVKGKARIGQQRFRQEMLSRYNYSCAICGPLPGAVLEAAHVYRYSDKPQHDLDGGLLLRRDLHALFDRFDLLIDPDDDWRVSIRPSYQKYPEIWQYHGAELKIHPTTRPNDEYLRQHALDARETWLSTGD